MNLKSKFGNCLITQTLNIALYMKAGRNYTQTDERTDGQTNGQSDYLMPPADLSGRGHKNYYNAHICCVS